MKGSWVRYIAATAAALLVILSLFLFFRPEEIETVKVSRGEISSGIEEDGYVQPIDDRNIFSAQTARVTGLPVEAGDHVSRGQILVRMNNPDLEALLAEVRSGAVASDSTITGYASAESSLALLLKDEKLNLERKKKLFEAGALSRAEMEKAILAVERYEKDLKELKARLGSAKALGKGMKEQLVELEKKAAELTVRAPIDGYVLNLPVEVDQVVMTGDLVVSLAVKGEMEIRSDVLSDSLRGVKTGQPVGISGPVLGERVLEGRVKKIYPLAEEKVSPLGVAQRRVPVIVTLPVTEDLKPGYEVRIVIETSRRPDSLLLPVESIRSGDGVRKVFRVQDGKIRETLVTTGITDRRMVEILEGLEEGEIVARDASLDLREGQRVREQNHD